MEHREHYVDYCHIDLRLFLLRLLRRPFLLHRRCQDLVCQLRCASRRLHWPLDQLRQLVQLLEPLAQVQHLDVLARLDVRQLKT